MITTVGKLMLDKALPAGVRPSGVVNKSGLAAMLKKIGEHHPERYAELVGKIKDVGNAAAYFSGTSFTIDDLKPETEMRDEAFKKHEHDLRAIYQLGAEKPHLRNNPEYLKKKIQVLSAIESHVNGGVKKLIEEPKTNITKWVAAGAKGDAAMARQMIGMSGLNVDVANRMVPEIARNSFSEGLSPIDFHVHANGARKGVVLTYTAVQAPGAFAKELNALASDMVISQIDCGTRRGRSVSTTGADCLDRFLAEDVPGVAHAGELITPVLKDRIAHKKPTVMVRSPLFCQARNGLCAHCFGLNENGRIPAMGEHVGMKAAQALTEPLTQLALNNKHAGGVVTAGKSPLEQILQFMHAPKNFANAATLSRVSGAVKSVEPAPAGGFFVKVQDQKHYVPPDRELVARVGQVVARGDALSSGVPHPGEVIEHKGMDHGREYFADGLRQVYGESGIKGHAKVFETVSRSIVNLGQVLQPGDTGHVPGDMVHWNTIQEKLDQQKRIKMPVGQAAGHILASEHGGLPDFHLLTPKSISALRSKSIHEVEVFHPDSVVVKPILLGTERASLHKGDWMANLAFRFLTPTFKENVATGATSDIHGYNPFSAYAYGAEFGKGEGGRF